MKNITIKILLAIIISMFTVALALYLKVKTIYAISFFFIGYIVSIAIEVIDEMD